MKSIKRKLCTILCATLLAGILIPTVNAASFSDVSGHWAESYIETCADRGIVNGIGGGLFNPSGEVTNSQFVKMLSAAFYDAEEKAVETTNITRIEEIYGASVPWYAGTSYFFTFKGFLKNVDYIINDTKSVNQPMTRNNMAQVAANVLANKGITANESDIANAQASIPDYDTIPEKNRDAVKTCYALGIITGVDGGRFDGNSTMTRAQACTVITRMLNAVGINTSGEITPHTGNVWDQTFYNTLTQEQKSVYESLDDSSRNFMKQDIERKRILEAEGWIVDGRDSTGEELAESWKHVQVGQ